MRVLAFAALALLVSAPLAAQDSQLRARLSTRATTTLTLVTPRVEGQPTVPPKTVSIDYGQPHVRGRDVPTELSGEGTIWRTGADGATVLKSDVELTIGGTTIPAGSYSLYTIRERGQYFLIINANTGQWGTEYDATKDVARVVLRKSDRHQVQESLQIAMVPQDAQSARGVLTISWGKLDLSADWSAK